MGAINLDGGIIHVGGQDHQQMTPHISRSMGIEVIYQEFNLVPTMSVAENIFLGDKVGGKYLVDYKTMKSKAREIFKLFNVDTNPDELVQDLSPAKQQIVEIAKAVSKNVKILIMVEPSAPLSVSEVEHMFEIIKHLKPKGVTIIYISHRLEEVFRISDRVSVMRDGRYVATKLSKDTSRKELINLMVGRELKETYPPRANPLNMAENENQRGLFFVGFLIGSSLGVLAGIFFATKSGKELRADIKEKGSEVLKEAKDIYTDAGKAKEILEEAKHQAKEFKKEADRHLSEARQKAKEILARGEKKETATGEADT